MLVCVDVFVWGAQLLGERLPVISVELVPRLEANLLRWQELDAEDNGGVKRFCFHYIYVIFYADIDVNLFRV